MWTNIQAFFIAFVLMEAVAWTAHKYLMHGFLWFLHEDHHKKDPLSKIEKNDWFFVIFASPAIVLIYLGISNGFDFRFWAGLGISAYGLTYFIVHEVFIHQRLPYLRRTDVLYFQAIRKAHRQHHIHKEKESGECFGMLWVPLKYYKNTKK